MITDFSGLIEVLRGQLAQLPRQLVQDEVLRGSIICLLRDAVVQIGLVPVPYWKPPRSTRDRIDLVGVALESDPPKVEVAFVVDPLVELPKVKALEWVECPQKVAVTFHERGDKVQQSKFFLKKDMIHLHLG